jgi:transcription elongation factor GreA
MKEYRLTREGYKMLLSELDNLVKNKRKEVAERLKEAKEFGGDLAENPEYEHAKNDQSFIEGRIEQINEILKNYKIVSNRNKKGIVDLGRTVVIRYLGERENRKNNIESSIESDHESNKISDESPIGKALLDEKIGNEIFVNTPQGKRKLKIIDII